MNFADTLGSSTSYKPKPKPTMSSTSSERSADSGDDEADEVSHLLNLPPELRGLVYDELLTREGPIFCYSYWTDAFMPAEQRFKCAILRTCKLIHQEATPVLYGGNTLQSSAYGYKVNEGFPRFIQNIGTSARYISKVKIVGGCTYTGMKKTCTLLKAAKALSSLTIEYTVLDSWTRKYTAERLAKDLGPLARLLHRNQLKETDKKPRDVLAGLQILPEDPMYYDHWKSQAESDAESAEYERKIKELLRATLK